MKSAFKAPQDGEKSADRRDSDRPASLPVWKGDLTENKDPMPLEAGRICPRCGHGRLDYDGLLNLVCPECGFSESGSFT